MSHVLASFVWGYAEGKIGMPAVTVVFPPHNEPAAPAGPQDEPAAASEEFESVPESPARRVFDPELIQPETTPAPIGTPRQVAWSAVIFFGQLRAINQRQHRGATDAERLDIAQAAGYQDRRGFSGWPGTWRDDETGARWITDQGVGLLHHYASELDISLPTDIS
jgi:hypothetical protein